MKVILQILGASAAAVAGYTLAMALGGLPPFATVFGFFFGWNLMTYLMAKEVYPSYSLGVITTNTRTERRRGFRAMCFSGACVLLSIVGKFLFQFIQLVIQSTAR